jgi:hypothetical protein
MNPLEKEDILKSLHIGLDVFLKAVATVPEELFGRRPGPGRWSVLECVEHVAVAEEYLLSQVRASRHLETPLMNKQREAAIRQRGSDRTRRIESPNEGRPTGRFLSAQEGISHFIAVRQQTIQFVESCETDFRCMLTDHPIIGPVNCHEMLLMMAVHTHRHAKQIEEIRDSLETSG